VMVVLYGIAHLFGRLSMSSARVVSTVPML
jgi:hypothetical protein